MGKLNAGKNKGLVLSEKQNEALSKYQIVFYKLIQQIEKLRKKVTETETILDEKLDYYSRHIHPIEQQMLDQKKTILKLIFPFYKDKSLLSQNQRKTLHMVIRGLMQDVFTLDRTEPDAELQEIFSAVEGIGYEEAGEQSFKEIKVQMEQMFRSQGVHVDFSDMSKDTSDEEISRRVHEANQKVKEAQAYKQEQKASGKKSKKETQKLEKERLIEEAKNKNISNIYKQLVKVLHPDLEQDEHKRPVKEELMKQLSIAYKNHDLHALLKLEMEWINMEESNTQRMADDKLKIYNEVLQQQVQDLQHQIHLLIHHPRYQPLDPYLDIYRTPKDINLPLEKRIKEDMLETLMDSAHKLNSKNAMREIKELIRLQKQIYDADMY
jgi:hypothetical protein